MAGSGWTIVEASSFDAGVAACGGHAQVEEIIAPVKLGLNRNPSQFPETKYPGIHIAKTKPHWKGAEIVLGLSIWFRVTAKSQTVELLHVEVTNPDAWSWSDDDEIPF